MKTGPKPPHTNKASREYLCSPEKNTHRKQKNKNKAKKKNKRKNICTNVIRVAHYLGVSIMRYTCRKTIFTYFCFTSFHFMCVFFSFSFWNKFHLSAKSVDEVGSLFFLLVARYIEIKYVEMNGIFLCADDLSQFGCMSSCYYIRECAIEGEGERVKEGKRRKKKKWREKRPQRTNRMAKTFHNSNKLMTHTQIWFNLHGEASTTIFSIRNKPPWPKWMTMKKLHFHFIKVNYRKFI